MPSPKRTRDKLAVLPGVRSVRRPVHPGSDRCFDLYYVRTGRKSARPIVIVPGGPGMASVATYRGLRRRAAAAGLDVIMVEHRGVGLSRRDDAGVDLPVDAISVESAVDDIAAVLDDAGVQQATIYGTSYGTYLAAGVGVRHPQRVGAMVLDSPLLSSHDLEAVRTAVRGLLLDGTDPAADGLAPKVRRLLETGVLSDGAGEVAAMVYGFAGPRALSGLMDLLLDGRPLLWRALTRVNGLSTRNTPFHHEIDLMGHIAFGELNFAGVPDGLPLDPAIALRETAAPLEPFVAEPYDLVAEMPAFGWPTAVVSGGRDLVTPPAVAERIAGLIPDAQLVRLPTAGHSVLDFRERAALAVVEAIRSAKLDLLPAAGPELDRMPGRPAVRALVTAIRVGTRAEAALPRYFRKPILV